MLLERTQTIGILKALGMSDGGIQQIFIARSLFITLVGAVIGDILGVGLCLAQKHLHLIKLDSEGYFLSEVPISLSPLSVVLLDVGVIALLMAILTLPTLIISRIKPEKTIRFQ
jgi:lipoprotein-releasing system permease protein